MTSGRPTVVFENGGGVPYDTWAGVITELKATDRACAYDRAGIGMSPAAPAPRTVRDQVVDLKAALDAVGVTGPIVYVAHSAGGDNAIVYTADHPDQVVGVVLVDVRPPGLGDALLAELPPETPDEFSGFKDLRRDFGVFFHDPSLNPEGLDIAAGDAEAEAAPGFGDRPTEILWATNSDIMNWPGFDPELAKRLNAAIERSRAAVEALAADPKVSRVPTGHFIQDEQPDVVIDAIRRVLDQAGS
jgi:pimeloyl-ACP methyl ester carboxylesterase